jgi:type IV secretory pathway VirJ component
MTPCAAALLAATLCAAPPPATVAKDAVKDLPLVEVPATGGETGDLAAVFLSGDGGWAALDKAVSRKLAAGGLPVLGLDSLKYFWKRREPEAAAADLARASRYALEVWGKKRLVLIGYSFGADVLPALVNRLPEDVRARISALVLLGLSDTATFEIHITSWIGGKPKNGQPVAPEIAKLHVPRIVCVYGEEEKGSYCPSVKGATLIELKGGHHFDRDYDGIARRLEKELRRR